MYDVPFHDLLSFFCTSGESKDSKSFRVLKRKVLQAALEVVLKPFKDASHRYVLFDIYS